MGHDARHPGAMSPERSSITMATPNTPVPPRKKANLATAKTVDAALPAMKSVYEIVGMNDSVFGKESFEQFQRKIASLDLYSLQDMARKVNVIPHTKREVLVDRLEKRFLQDRMRAGPPKAAVVAVNEDLREQALRTLSRAR